MRCSLRYASRGVFPTRFEDMDVNPCLFCYIQFFFLFTFMRKYLDYFQLNINFNKMYIFYSVLLSILGVLLLLYGLFGIEPNCDGLFFPKASAKFQSAVQMVFLVFWRIAFSISGICTLIYALAKVISSWGWVIIYSPWSYIIRAGIHAPIFLVVVIGVIALVWCLLKGVCQIPCLMWKAICWFMDKIFWLLKAFLRFIWAILYVFYHYVLRELIFVPMGEKFELFFYRLKRKKWLSLACLYK